MPPRKARRTANDDISAFVETDPSRRGRRRADRHRRGLLASPWRTPAARPLRGGRERDDHGQHVHDGRPGHRRQRVNGPSHREARVDLGRRRRRPRRPSGEPAAGDRADGTVEAVNGVSLVKESTTAVGGQVPGTFVYTPSVGDCVDPDGNGSYTIADIGNSGYADPSCSRRPTARTARETRPADRNSRRPKPLEPVPGLRLPRHPARRHDRRLLEPEHARWEDRRGQRRGRRRHRRR